MGNRRKKSIPKPVIESDARAGRTSKTAKNSGTAGRLSNTNTKLVKTKQKAALLKNSKNKDHKKVYQCVLCDEKFTEHRLMIEHFRKHGERKQTGPLLPPKLENKNRSSDLINCEWCSEVFVTISKAIEHKFRKHRYEGTNYFCKHCGKLFPLKVALQLHSHSEHNTPKDTKVQSEPDDSNCLFLCKFCSVSFSTLAAVKFHENGAHQMEQRLQSLIMLPPASKKVKVNKQGEVTTLYYCHLCGNEYMVKYNLMKHLNMSHTVEEKAANPTDGIIKCRACDSIFYNLKAYIVHNIQHKPDDLYVASEEERQKVVNRVDQDFDIRRVPNPPPSALPIPKPILVKKLKQIGTSNSHGKKLKRIKNSKATEDVNGVTEK